MRNNPEFRLAPDHDHAKIIGLGGIGSIAAAFLAQFMHSRRRNVTLSLIDGDAFEVQNQDRMLFDEFGNKAIVRARELSHKFPGFVDVVPVPHYVSEHNVHALIQEHDLVFLCVDNHATRKLVNDRCRGLRDIVLISGGNDGVENGKDGTFGNVQLFVRSRGAELTNHLTVFHPEIDRPADRAPALPGCDELAVTSAPQLLFTNLAIASAMLNTFFCCLSGLASYEELYVSIAKGTMVPVRREVVMQ
jgi:molybdopterin/thiamine biosynthesis adenylyltransferase